MARILAYTSPARGHLFPVTPILDELHARGHEISLRTLASEVEMMRSRGFATQPISGDVEALELQDYLTTNPRKSIASAAKTFGERAAIDGPDLQQAIEDERPDALIVDLNSWGAAAAAEAWGGPWSTFCPFPLILRSPDAPPFGPGLPPAKGPLGRLRDRALAPLVFGTIEKQMLPVLNGVRERFGLPHLASIDDIIKRPPLLISMTAEPFEYPRSDWPESVFMAGPCAWEPPAEQPEWLDKIDAPIVLVTTSSESQDDGKLIATAFEALAEEPVFVVATVPSGEPGQFVVPANGRVERFIPHGHVLDRAICAITHGGMGATQKALARGVPVCAVPFGRDQMEVAQRVEVAQAGTRLPVGKLTPDRLRKRVREAISRAEGARRIAAAYAATGGPAAAAVEVERRLLQPSQAPTYRSDPGVVCNSPVSR